jgi:ribosomal protein S18 acetylase RimI-like enzyme
MSGSSNPGLLRRLVEFELDLKRLSSAVVQQFDWGRLIVNPETSALWTDNFLEAAPAAGADQLAAAADELLGGRGMEHRYVVPSDPEHGEELTPRFRELGWEIDRGLYMVHTQEAERSAPAAVEVPRTKVEGVRRAVAEDDPLAESLSPDFAREAIEQQSIKDERLDRTANGRWFAAPPDEAPGAACVLYELDSVGQVETVGTLPERRGQGLASAVVLAAVEASHRAGHELTFIVAEADNWPWQLYERLGFDRVGEAPSFLRKPDQVSAG